MSTRHPVTQERLCKASDSAAFLVSELRESLRDATDLEAILLLDAIELAVAMQTRIRAIADATS